MALVRSTPPQVGHEAVSYDRPSPRPNTSPGSRSRTDSIVTGNKVNPSSPTYWNGYDYSKPPSYPDTSYGAWLRAGGSVLGIGYSAWRDKQVQDYNTALNLWKTWYESAPEQYNRLAASGLNTNLAYGSVSPGGGNVTPGSASPTPTVAEVASQGASAVSGLSGGIKTLAEAAKIINELPESRYKGNLARQLDAAAAAGAINAGNTYSGILYNARITAGVGKSKAEAEYAQGVYDKARNEADKQVLDYVSSHNADGSPTDFEGSLYRESRSANLQNAIVLYRTNKSKYDELFCKPDYWTAVLTKAKNEATITGAEAWRVNTIMKNPHLSDSQKIMELHRSTYGFWAQLVASLFDISGRSDKRFRSEHPEYMIPEIP